MATLGGTTFSFISFILGVLLGLAVFRVTLFSLGFIVFNFCHTQLVCVWAWCVIDFEMTGSDQGCSRLFFEWISPLNVRGICNFYWAERCCARSDKCPLLKTFCVILNIIMNGLSKVHALLTRKCMYTHPILVKTGCGLCVVRKGIWNFFFFSLSISFSLLPLLFYQRGLS